MASLDHTTPATRFDSFAVYRTSYKKIGNHEIEVGILVPKDLEPGKHPVIVKFHGGGLITGDCLYPDWLAAFFIPLIHRNSAITILPNYRLIPEHNGADITSDLADFWTWFHNGNVDKYLSSQSRDISLDYEHVLVSGDSAGGYMALMSALTLPRDRVQACLAQYPMTWYLRRSPAEEFLDEPAPGPEIIDEHMSSVTPDTVISSATPPARMRLSYAMSVFNRYLEFFGDDKKLWPMYLIEDKDWAPPTWIIHGDADTAVSIEDSREFVEKWKARGMGNEARLDVREGMEHGFDIGMRENEEKWLRDGLGWVEGKWLGQG
ncbi:alpha/beta-hydrolase [Setomelanomma holmii]|uniref:Alpha/beta-hydrolase n=1 Tax=Setomelanomma holmii TaxID=210430 RepID=A0A9P4LNH0_9PLEO|nr:alpha/beta-hydrolase [Setomelanomma holmii]